MLAKASTIVSYDKVVNDGVIKARTFTFEDYNDLMRGFIDGLYYGK